jgi:signal transduction histidine kinase
MKKVALVFVLAVFVPSLVLAWLAVRSLRDQEFALERQRTLLYQGAAESVAREIISHVENRQREFKTIVEKIIGAQRPRTMAEQFDARLREIWPLADVGFVVSLEGEVLAPSLFSRPAAHKFRLENDRFLSSRETVEVYWEEPKGSIASKVDPKESGKGPSDKTVFATKSGAGKDVPGPSTGAAEFRQLIGDSNEGTLARFLQDKLTMMFWCRMESDPSTVFGAQVKIAQLAREVGESVRIEPGLASEVVLALLDDEGRARDTTRSGFNIAGRTPIVTRELGEVLPHWKVAAFVVDPSRFSHSAGTLKLTLGLLIALLLLAIGVGGWLIVTDLKRQLTLARQKTDFVSNVSHELKTPLTSIRMFSELLAEGRIEDRARQKRFLNIITAETARLTRLINNVLDFARIERGEKKYQFQELDMAALVNETVTTYRPHLEESGFTLRSVVPEQPLEVTGDRDALAQVLVNLISNAEKYGGEKREIEVSAGREDGQVVVKVSDRGLGVPPGCEQKIFEQFFRAHDSLSSGIQGTGLGLTLARQIARAHGGDVAYAPRDGGGSCFALRLPANGEG